MQNTPRDGGQLLVQSLVALGAVKSFGVPGESYLAVLDALHDTVGTPPPEGVDTGSPQAAPAVLRCLFPAE